jgi:hypothetical protein
VCPAWIPHSQDFRRWLRTWGIGNQNLYELLTGVLPTAVVNRSWQDYETDLWGVTTLTTSPVGNIPGLSVVAGPTFDCLIRQVDVLAYQNFSVGANGTVIPGQACQVFSPEGGYNAVALGLSEFHPGLLATRNFALPQARFFTGWNTGFNTDPPFNSPFSAWSVVLDSHFNAGNNTWFPVQLCFTNGPTALCPAPAFTGALAPTGNINIFRDGFMLPKSTRLWAMEQPPLRVAAGTILDFQLNAVPSVGYNLQVSLLFQEVNASEI